MPLNCGYGDSYYEHPGLYASRWWKVFGKVERSKEKDNGSGRLLTSKILLECLWKSYKLLVKIIQNEKYFFI